MDDPLLRFIGLRRSCRLSEEFAYRVHQKGQDSHPGHRRRTRCRMSHSAVLRVLARVKDAWHSDTASGASRRRPSLSQTREPDRSTGSHGCLVRQVSEIIRENSHSLGRTTKTTSNSAPWSITMGY